MKCGHCKEEHEHVNDVLICSGQIKLCMTIEPHAPHRHPGGWCPGASVRQGAVEQRQLRRREPVTQRQLDYIFDLGGDVRRAARYTKAGASDYITNLKKKGKQMDHLNAPNRTQTKVPIPMLQEVPDGFYAARPDDSHAHTFFRFSRPKSGNYQGALKIQTQHGPDYKLALVVWPSGTVQVYNKSAEDDLLLVVVDKNGCAIAYAEKIGRCMRCNTELTDERSRYYGIGPECEKHWPHIIDIQDDTKGPFEYSNGS